MDARVLVLDASTAILLAKIGLLRTIASMGEVWMAEGAYREATVKESAPDAGDIRSLAESGLLRQAAADHTALARLRKDFRLGQGEAESLALALDRNAICGTDDGPAIRCLRILGIPFTSTVALTVALAEARRLDAVLALALLDKLGIFGRYDPRILEDAARRIRSAGGGTKRGQQ